MSLRHTYVYPIAIYNTYDKVYIVHLCNSYLDNNGQPDVKFKRATLIRNSENKKDSNLNDTLRLRKTVLRHVVRARLTGLSIPQGVSQVEAASGDKVTRQFSNTIFRDNLYSS